jgi:hypothetical protein
MLYGGCKRGMWLFGKLLGGDNAWWMVAFEALQVLGHAFCLSRELV